MPLRDDLPEPLRRSTRLRAIDADAALFRQDDHADAIFEVEQGRLRLIRHTDREVVLHTARKGELFAGAALLNRAQAAQKAGYARSTPGRNYGYLRLSQKEPFGLLDWTPAISVIANADDLSFSVTPEIVYSGIENLELRLRVGYLHGDRLEEYGEKQNDYRIEVRARYFF